MYLLQIPLIENENSNIENSRNLNLIASFITRFNPFKLLSKKDQTYFKNHAITPKNIFKYICPFSTFCMKGLRQHFEPSFLRNISVNLLKFSVELYYATLNTQHLIFSFLIEIFPSELF